MPTNAEIANDVSDMINKMRAYQDQQYARDTGTATYTSGPVNGIAQPEPGYYPMTNPDGLFYWSPSLAKMKADLAGFPTLRLTGANSYTANATHNGKFVYVYNNGAATCNVTLPTGLGRDFNAIYLWMGTNTAMSFIAGAGTTVDSSQGLTRVRARLSYVTVTAPTADNFVLGGDLIP